MHFAMSYYPKDSGGGGPGRYYRQPPAAATAAVPAKQRQTMAMHHGNNNNRQRTAKSQPFDADDLRRRLYVVLAEQESSRQQKRYARMEEVAARARAERNNNNNNNSAAAKGREEEGEEGEGEGESELVEVKRASVASHDAAGDENANFNKTSSWRTDLNTTTTAPYRHVPQVAASQFVRTTTAEAVDRRRLHALSYSALSAHADGGAQVNNNNNNNSAAGHQKQLQTKRSLRRVQSQRDNSNVYYERSQNSRFVEGCYYNNTTGTGVENNNSNSKQNRHSMMVYGKPSYTDLSSAAAAANANANGMNIRRSRSALEDYPTEEDDSGVDFFVPDLATVNEHHRVDWTQSDESGVHLDVESEAG
ncbi:hypothetical protein UCREL1_1029 [Eutypa lata UCREL1]|uniref:Uncharacterized protein n=1 Tax=Eutypa lata (strain UCR-EL1) TaxID=1287681 RepID=M7TYY7_EUTLA|nr:hypothetical protein UCREL1_1029 [Eutypa lata UCREL1]